MLTAGHTRDELTGWDIIGAAPRVVHTRSLEDCKRRFKPPRTFPPSSFWIRFIILVPFPYPRWTDIGSEVFLPSLPLRIKNISCTKPACCHFDSIFQFASECFPIHRRPRHVPGMFACLHRFPQLVRLHEQAKSLHCPTLCLFILCPFVYIILIGFTT